MGNGLKKFCFLPSLRLGSSSLEEGKDRGGWDGQKQESCQRRGV